MIRPAQESDLRRIVEMSERFYPHTSYAQYSNIPLDPNQVAYIANTLIEGSVMNVLEIDGEVVGMIGLVFIPFMFNPSYIHAGEIVWWVEPEYQKFGWGEQLLLSIEEPCRQAEVRHIQMIDLVNSSLSAAKLYEKLGYKLTERSYTKVI